MFNAVVVRVGSHKKHPPVSVGYGQALATGNVTPSGTAQTVVTAPNRPHDEDIAVILFAEEPVWVEVGPSATAAAGTSFAMGVTGGIDRMELAIAPGHSVSVITR